MRISDWSSDVCSSDLHQRRAGPDAAEAHSALHPILLEHIIERRPADPEQFRGGRDIALALRHRAAERDATGGLARAAAIQTRLFAIFDAASPIAIPPHHTLTAGPDTGAPDAVFKVARIIPEKR